MRKLLLSGLAVLLMAAAPPVPSPVTIPDRPERLRFAEARFEPPAAEGLRHQLSNGIPVYLVEDHSLPLVDVAVAVRTGDWLDAADRVGLASFAGALIRRGGTASKTPDEFDEQVDFLGAQINSVAGTTRSGATLNVSSQRLGEALDLYCEMLRAPRFDESRVTVTRENLRESLSRRTDDPLEVLTREWGRLLYGPDHYNVREVTPRNLEVLVPAELAAFHRSTWRPDAKSMVIAVSGDVTPADVLPRLEKCFSGWPAPTGAAPSWPPPASSHVPAPGFYYVDRDTPQAKILLGHLGAKRKGWDDPDEPALLVLSEVLGGGASRIQRRLRGELGIAYRTSATFEVGLHEPGLFQIFLETENASAGRALQAALAEVRRLREEPVPEAELAFARNGLIDSFPLRFEDAATTAGLDAEDEYLGRPHSSWRAYRDRIRRVTPEQVQRVAQRYLQPEKIVALVVGRWGDITRGASGSGIKMESLVRGPVTRLPERDPVTLAPR